jgi:hypothetical protein
MNTPPPTYLPQATPATVRQDNARFARLTALGVLAATALGSLPRSRPVRLARNVALAYTVGTAFCTGASAALYVDQCRRDRG